MKSEAVVLWGANNIFSLQDAVTERIVQCRIKGKILDRGSLQEYNPLSPGDKVIYEYDESSDGEKEGVIISRHKRKNAFIRYNQKRLVPQSVAANIDLLVAVCSPVMPPFRPRFIDRVLVAAGESIPVLIVLNKFDQIDGYEDIAGEAIAPVYDRLAAYSNAGYEVLKVSAIDGKGIPELNNCISGKVSAFFGQSGVGKSTLLNVMFPSLDLKIGEISTKHNRGRHTTTLSRGYPVENGLVIDTPGVREIIPFGIDPGELDFMFPDFVPFIGNCQFQPCSHREEPDCAVREAVETARIHYDRYESYLRLHSELERLNSEARY
jgi:ribosome biogenesis GTPase / thiamine phosphate phosphatase